MKCAVTSSAGLCMAGTIIRFRGLAYASAAADRYLILADAFTVPGVIIFLLGVLVILAKEGAFDGVFYAAGYAVSMLIPGIGRELESYGSYLERKRKKGSLGGFCIFFVIGGIFMAAASVFIILFYRVGIIFS